jgi:hypothetical protein
MMEASQGCRDFELFGFLVQQRNDTNAAELMREHGEKEKVNQNAWNNRLASLANLGLVVELSEGRSKRYRPLLAGATYGN